MELNPYDIVNLELGTRPGSSKRYPKKWHDYIRSAHNRHQNYVGPASDSQIKTIVAMSNLEKNGAKIYSRLFSLFADQIIWSGTADKNAEIIHNIFKRALNGASDSEIFSYLYPYVKKIRSNINAQYGAQYVANSIGDQIKQVVKRPVAYLDYGAGNGQLAVALGQALYLQNKNVYATDLNEGFEVAWGETILRLNKEKKLTFKPLIVENNAPARIPFEEKFDVITCLMVLHHIPTEHLVSALIDIREHLTPKGVLLIKEHDSQDTQDMIIADLIHDFYILRNVQQLEGVPPAINKIKEQTMNYYDIYEWSLILKMAGFKRLYLDQTGAFGVKAQTTLGRNFIAIYGRD